MAYQHPGQQFIQQYGLLMSQQDGDRYVTQYADFLRHSAGLENSIPIDLDHIYRHFEMPVPYRAPLVEQQGILVDGDAGIILIKEDDPRVRQRFTEGHELMELLFDAHNQAITERENGPTWQGPMKEKWCDRGAAELLMPQVSFGAEVEELGFSFSTARTLSKNYLASFMATLLHMLEQTKEPYALVVWHWAVSRADQAKSDRTGVPPTEKLRVWWCKQSQHWDGGFIPKNRSIARPSCIIDTALYQKPHSAIESLNFQKTSVQCYVEAIPLRLADKNCVISLLNTNIDCA